MKIELNQEVIVVGIGNNARYSTRIEKVIVSKIGRKWFYVDCTDNPWMARDNKFSLENGKSDGKGYPSEWQAFKSEEDYNESKERPKLILEIKRNIEGLNYKQLLEIYLLMNLKI